MAPKEFEHNNPICAPRATYRLQFTPTFGFRHALELLPYLQTLGISHIYASPITRARRGSMHGYDVCDPRTANPELGSPEELDELLGETKRRGMGWVQDIVPNHMAYSHENPFMVDVLEHGRASRYADFFDINWEHQNETIRGRVLAPFLGKPYGQCVVDGDLKLVMEEGGLWLTYYEQRYPLTPESYWVIFGEDLERLCSVCGDDSEDYISFCGVIHTLKNSAAVKVPRERGTQCSLAKSVLARLVAHNHTIASYVQECLGEFVSGPGAEDDFGRFDDLITIQNFRPAFWKVAAEELNYRRFFTISDLICLHAEKDHVFEEMHRFILDLVEQGLITGLRIDHLDGLFNPAQYLEKLRRRAPGAYIVIEKVLDKAETIPREWPIEGTTGYDFLNHINYLLCDQRANARLDQLYNRFIGRRVDARELEIAKKRLIVGKHMAGDIDNLARLITGIAGMDLMGRDITLYALRRALVEVLTHFSVYRTYITPTSFSEEDKHQINKSLRAARETEPGLTLELDFIERFLMLREEERWRRGDDKELDYAWKAAVMRFQQFTGPLMAKGFEDTFFYIYNRHVALNEVGGWPVHFGISMRDFHSYIGARQQVHPWSMNSTATHDTKRGEDTRARLQVLTEIPDQWARRALAWKKHNRSGKVGGLPDENDEFMLYQTLVGTMPLEGSGRERLDDRFRERITAFMIKAVKEAKVHTAWVKPDEEYEKAVVDFVGHCLDLDNNAQFVTELVEFSRQMAWFGMLNSLTQSVLKFTLPGVPDIYQGAEDWDFSLVDPDNRRPVDYRARQARLAMVEEFGRGGEVARRVLEEPIGGPIKMFLVLRCLQARLREERLFMGGDYVPHLASGDMRQSALVFTRHLDGGTVLVVAPRFASRLVPPGEFPLGRRAWGDTRIRMPVHHGAPRLPDGGLRDIFTGRVVLPRQEMYVGDLLEEFPVGVYIGGI